MPEPGRTGIPWIDLHEQERQARQEQKERERPLVDATQPYDLEALNSLGATVWQADELRQKYLVPGLEERRKWINLPENQHLKRWADDGTEIPVQPWDIAQEFAGNALAQGSVPGAKLWEAIAQAEWVKHRETQKAAEAQWKSEVSPRTDTRTVTDAMRESIRTGKAPDVPKIDPTYEQAATSFMNTSLSWMNARTMGVQEIVNAGFGSAVADFFKLTPEQYRGAGGYRKAKQELTERLQYIGATEGLGIVDGSIAENINDFANLHGWIRGAGAMQKSSTAGLARLAGKKGVLPGLGKGGLLWLTGTTPKAAARALGKLGAQGSALPGAKRTLAQKAGTWFADTVSSAANFGAYEGLTAMVRTMDETLQDLPYATADGTMFDPRGNGALEGWIKRAPVWWQAYKGGALSGAFMPTLQGAAGMVKRGAMIGAPGRTGIKTFKGASWKDIQGVLGSVSATRIQMQQAIAEVFSKGVEFMGFGLMPHLDPKDRLNLDTFHALIGDDEAASAKAWKTLFGHYVNGALLGGLGVAARKSKGGALDPGKGGPVRDRIDWYKAVYEGRGKKQYPALPRGDKSAEEVNGAYLDQLWEAIKRGEIDGSQFEGASDATLIAIVEGAAELYKSAPEEVRAQLVYQLLQHIDADQTLTSRIKKRPDQAGMERNIIAELVRETKERQELSDVHQDAEGKLALAFDDLNDAKARMLPGMAEADPVVREIQEKIKGLAEIIRGVGEELAAEGPKPLTTQMAELQKALGQRQLVLFKEMDQQDAGVKEAMQRVVSATHDLVVEKLKEQEAAKKKATAKQSGEDILKAAGIELPKEGEGAPEAAKLFPDGKGAPSKGGAGTATPAKPAPAPAQPAPSPAREAAKQAKVELKEREANRRAAAKARADDVLVALMEAEGPAEATSLAKYFRDRAEEVDNNPSHAKALLDAASVLETRPLTVIEAAYRKAGYNGLRGLGMGESAAKFIAQMMKLEREPSKPPAPGQKPVAAVSSPAALLAKAFRTAGRPLSPGTEPATLRRFQGLTTEQQVDQLRKMAVPDAQHPPILAAIAKAFGVLDAPAGSPAVEEAAAAAAPKAAPKAEVVVEKSAMNAFQRLASIVKGRESRGRPKREVGAWATYNPETGKLTVLRAYAGDRKKLQVERGTLAPLPTAKGDVTIGVHTHPSWDASLEKADPTFSVPDLLNVAELGHGVEVVISRDHMYLVDLSGTPIQRSAQGAFWRQWEARSKQDAEGDRYYQAERDESMDWLQVLFDKARADEIKRRGIKRTDLRGLADVGRRQMRQLIEALGGRYMDLPVAKGAAEYEKALKAFLSKSATKTRAPRGLEEAAPGVGLRSMKTAEDGWLWSTSELDRLRLGIAVAVRRDPTQPEGTRGTWVFPVPPREGVDKDDVYTALRYPLIADNREQMAEFLGLDYASLRQQSEQAEWDAFAAAGQEQGHDALLFVGKGEAATTMVLLDKGAELKLYKERMPVPQQITLSQPDLPLPKTVDVGRARRVWDLLRRVTPTTHAERTRVAFDDAKLFAERYRKAQTDLELAAAVSKGDDFVALRRNAEQARRTKEYYESIIREQYERDAIAEETGEPEGMGTEPLLPSDKSYAPSAELQLQEFQGTDNAEIVRSLEENIEKWPELAQNLGLIKAGQARSQTYESDPERGKNVSYSASFGDRIIVRTTHGVVGGMVVSQPTFGAGEPGRRVKLYDGKQVHRVRLADIIEWAPETYQDIDFSVGRDGVQVRNGGEVTNAAMQRMLAQPRPTGIKEILQDPKLAKQRTALRDGTGTLKDAKEQAMVRAKRMRQAQGDAWKISPEDHDLEAQGWLVPPEQRRVVFVPFGQIGGGRAAATMEERLMGRNINELVKALTAQQEGKATKKQLAFITDMRANEVVWQSANHWVQPYFDPKVGKPRDPAELERLAKEAPSLEAREALLSDLNRYWKARGAAAEADARQKEMQTFRNRKNQEGGILYSMGVNFDETMAVMRREAWSNERGRWTPPGGGKKQWLLAVHQPETDTWWVRERENAELLADLREHFGFEGKNLNEWLSQTKQLLRADVEDGRQVVNIFSRNALLKRVQSEALDMILRAGHGERVEMERPIAEYDMEGEAILAEAPTRDPMERLTEIFGSERVRPLEKWLAKNPRPQEFDKAALSEWSLAWDNFIQSTIGREMSVMVDKGLDPISGRRMVQAETGEWGVEPAAPGSTTLGFFGMVHPHTGRNLVGVGKKLWKGLSSVEQQTYAILQGGFADTSAGVVQAFVTQPLARLNQAVIGAVTGGKDSADVATGWSKEADYIATRHNFALARKDYWTARADKLARAVGKLPLDQRIALIRAEHEGAKPPALNEFRKLMELAAREAKAVGLAGKDFDETWSGRYVRLGRYRWHDIDLVEKAMIDARKNVAELAEELKVFRERIQLTDVLDPAREGIEQAAAMKQRELVRQQKRQRAYEKQWKRLGARFLRPWGRINEVHGEPLSVVDARDVRHWENHDRRRKITDWDAAVKEGLDLSRPELLLWDSITHHFHAIEEARWLKKVGSDPRMSLPIREAPKDWVVIDKDEVRSSRAYAHLVGRALNPWVYHFMKLSEGPGGTLEKIMNDAHAAAKMGLTLMAPANWTLQGLANPMAVAANAGVSLFRAYPAYAKALFDVFNPLSGKQAAIQREFGRLRWLDIATDFDREFIQNMHRQNPHIDVDNISSMISSTLGAISAGNLGAAATGARKIVALPLTRALQSVSFVYRRLDAAARIADYRLQRQQGIAHEVAVQKVNRQWDLFHQNKVSDSLRKGVMTMGSKLKLPLPFFVQSFLSVPMTFLRNLPTILGKTPLQMAELATMVAIWNMTVQGNTGQSDEEVEAMLTNMYPQDNSLTHWLRTKTTPLTPDGAHGIDLWGYHPVGAALDAIPGGSAGFWGVAEGLSHGDIKGAIKGLWEGTDEWGQTAAQDILSRAVGGQHILLSPWSEYLLDRDAEGGRVRWKNERPGLLGATGSVQRAIETGQLPMGIILGLGALVGANPTATTEVAAFFNMLTQTWAKFDKTDIGTHPLVEMIDDGEELFEVKPRSWKDALMRMVGFKERSPNATRRALERIEATEGIKLGDRGSFELERGVAPERMADLRKLIAQGNEMKRFKSGAELWGYARHLVTLDPASAAFKNVKAYIQDRWPTVAGRIAAATALGSMEMGKEGSETMRLLRDLGLLEQTSRDKPLPKSKPEELRNLRGGR